MSTTNPGNNKVRSGCSTCKKRRVRCDEARPACQRCVKAKRSCEGYTNFVDFVSSDQGKRRGTANWQITTTIPTARPYKPTPERPLLEFKASESEWRAFNLYSEKAGIFSGAFDKKFWRDFVLQVATHEPAVRQGVIALGSFCPHILAGSELEKRSSCGCAGCVQGFRAYNKALNMIASPDFSRSKIHVALLTCLLFIGIEMMRGSEEHVIRLATVGLKLMAEDENALSSALVEKSLLPAFTRIRLCSALFTHTIDHIPKAAVERVMQRVHDPRLMTIEELRDSLFSIMAEALEMIHFVTRSRRGFDPGNDRMSTIEQERDYWSAMGNAWFARFTQWEAEQKLRAASMSDAAKAESAYMIALLKCYHLASDIWLHTVLSGSQRVYEQYEAEFTALLDAAESVLETPSISQTHSSSSFTPFTFEMGLLPPLYFVAYRCRKTSLRHRAISLLELVPTSEATWDKSIHIALAKRIMEVEEHGFQSSGGPMNVDCTAPGDVGRTGHLMHDISISPSLMGDNVIRPGPEYQHMTAKKGGLQCILTYYWFDDNGTAMRKDELLDVRTGKVVL
ncbi:hypothetical protein MBLNU457_4760t1 [Dothideomycetes sp. NU457]